jgi:gliding motility-associated-like protein
MRDNHIHIGHSIILPGLVFGLFLISFSFALGQNDDCNNPIELQITPGAWCSEIGEFSNEDATRTTSVDNPDCWPDDLVRADVWFTFIAQGTDASILINGNSDGTPGGSLDNPQFAVLEGNCGFGLTEIACISDAFSDNIIETFISNLTIGQRYYLYVSARFMNEGTFEICINSFNSVPDAKSDCRSAVLLCDKSSFTVGALQGTGLDNDEVTGSCIISEFASAWYKWICDEPGTLGFTLTPTNPNDDLDFALYELPGGLDDCDNKELLRCMASGEQVGQPPEDWEDCTGPTGLAPDEDDIVETAGCDQDDNNFVQSIEMTEGTAYVLVVNNFSNTGNGFTIDWSGDGTFLGPQADLVVLDSQTIECDKEFTIDEIIEFPLGDIVNYEWNFGVDANPQTINGEGPHAVEYNSIGNKSIVLGIESDSGCVVNQILNIVVEPCCEDLPDIDIQVDSVLDLTCNRINGIPDGFFSVLGSGGTPFYQYSLDGELYQFNPNFTQMEAGEYTVFIRDIKGCVDTVSLEVTQPPPLMVDVGPDITVDLGFGSDLTATVTPPGSQVKYTWSPSELVEPDDQPNVFTTPPGQTTYIVTVMDSAGCIAVDSVVLFVSDDRPVYIPNAISPNGDGTNDRLTIYSNPAGQRIKSVQVFNRWGDMVYEGRNLPLNDPLVGWDGTFNGRDLDPDIFVYRAVVEFIDGSELSFKGDIHLLK